jgi:hypothetical protein
MAVRDLALHFVHAIGIDPSAGMITTARSLGGVSSSNDPIRFEISSAEDLGPELNPPVQSNTVDLIVAATAAHWFDMPKFWHRAAQVLKPGGTLAATVPAWLPEQVCWFLSDEYHAPFVEGGHVRIYSEPTLRARMREAGLQPGFAHHAHALHSAYWWLKCAVGPTNDDNPLVKAYLQLLTWDIMGTEPVSTVTKLAERLLNPFLGKSLIVYAEKPMGTR